MTTALEQLIERNDPDPLLREIDNRCELRDWEGVLEVRDRCNNATERGKTLWGVAEHASYRLALEATGEYAALALSSDPGPLALGPLSEVAASTHEWIELAPHIEEGPMRGITAYECVSLGEDLSGDVSLKYQQTAFEMPLRIHEWEPTYEPAEYLEHEARFPAPVPTVMDTRLLAATSTEDLDDRQSVDAWRNMVTPWLTQSNGHARVVAVHGDVDGAITSIASAVTTAIQISGNDALRMLCWTAASGGAHGRRRGLAAGRSSTWRLLASICGLLDDGDMPPGDELGQHVSSLHWWTWGDLDYSSGWQLRLAVHDSVDGVSFAIDASDSLE